MQDSVELGDEVITAGGIHAIVKEVDDDRLQVEIAPGVVVTLDRRAVAAVAREIEVEVEPDADQPSSTRRGGLAGRCRRGNRRRNVRQSWLTCPSLGYPALSPLPRLPDPPRPRRRGVHRGAELAGPQAAQAGPRPAGWVGVRAEGAAAEGTQADGGRPRPLGHDHAEPRRQARRLRADHHEAGLGPDLDPARRASTTSTRRRRSSARRRNSSSTTWSRPSSRRRPRLRARSRRAASTASSRACRRARQSARRASTSSSSRRRP